MERRFRDNAAPLRRKASGAVCWVALASSLWAPCEVGCTVRASAQIKGLQRATYQVKQRFPHRSDCFTEALFINGSNGTEVFESCGLYAKSYFRRFDLHTGKSLKSAVVPKEFFSEGMALRGKSLYMLTYKAMIILEYDAHTFKEIRRHPFPYGQGWGLTFDGCDLLATTGSPFLYRLRPKEDGSLKLISKVQVTHQGTLLRNLNEIEFVTPKLWINQWLTNNLFRVDPVTGIAELQLTLDGLHSWSGEATPNGIAYSTTLGENALLVTGKLWPNMFLLELSSSDLCGAPVSETTCAVAPPSACYRSTLLPSAMAASSATPAAAAPAPTAPAPSVSAPAAPASASPAAPASTLLSSAMAASSATPAAAAPAHTAPAPSVSAPAAPASASSAAPASVTVAAESVEMVERTPLGSLSTPPSQPSDDKVAVSPLPGSIVVAAAAASLVLGVGAVAVPWLVASYRHEYSRVADQSGEA